MQVIIKGKKHVWNRHERRFIERGHAHKTTVLEKAEPLTKRDIINHNAEPIFGKVHPIMYAKSILHDRLIIDKNGATFLDGNHVTGGSKLNTIMQATNRVLKEQGKEQIGYSKEWLV